MPVPTSINYGQVATAYDNTRCVELGVAAALVEVCGRWALDPCSKSAPALAHYTAALTAAGFSMTAIDRSPAMVEIGAQKTAGRCILSDASALPLRARSVDAIAGVNVLHHLPALHAALAEFRRVARAGAALQAVVRENLKTLWYRHYFPEIDDALLPLHPTLGRFDHRDVSGWLSPSRGDEDPLLWTIRSHFRSGAHAASSLVRSAFPRVDLRFRRLDSAIIARRLTELERDLESGAFARIAALFDAAHADAADCVVITAH